ncbi:MAG TPA: HEAT repeat domain-containing protein [Planctomycetota bacterium]|nr:HEAT repeat domain-containing protein [Planctomycetota bacterium]
MLRKNGILPALGLLAWFAAPAAAQDVVWIETQFHRVHLRNGNFIDGKIVLVNDREVRLDVAPGQISFRRDMVDRIELMKMRSLGEKPKLDPPLKNSSVGVRGSERTSAAATGRHRASSLLPPVLDRGSKERVEAILGRLRIANPDQKDDLVAELARLGPGAAPYLASQLGNVDDESCQRLSLALIKLKEPAALPYLAEALEDDRPYVRIHALLVIGETGTIDSAAPVRALLSDPQDAVRASAIMALDRLGDANSLPEILDCLDSPDGAVRVAAINAALDLARKSDKMERTAEGLRKALDKSSGKATLDFISAIGRTGRQEQWSYIGPFLRDADPKTRATAAAALAGLAAPASEELILVRLAQEDDKRTRVQLAAAVRALKAMKAVEPLIGWLKSEDPDVSAAAEMALRAMTGQQFGVDYAKWSQWWDLARQK